MASQENHLFSSLRTRYLLMYRDRFLLISRETEIDRLLVSSELSAPIFTSTGNDDLWSCRTDLYAKNAPKNGDFEFSWTSRRVRVGFSNCLDLLMNYHGQCFQFSSQNLQWLTSFDFKKLYPLFGWAYLWYLLYPC